jgi:hypothetical protein
MAKPSLLAGTWRGASGVSVVVVVTWSPARNPCACSLNAPRGCAACVFGLGQHSGSSTHQRERVWPRSRPTCAHIRPRWPISLSRNGKDLGRQATRAPQRRDQAPHQRRPRARKSSCIVLSAPILFVLAGNIKVLDPYWDTRTATGVQRPAATRAKTDLITSR